MSDLWFFADAEEVSAPDRLRGLTVGERILMTEELAQFLRKTADDYELMELWVNERVQAGVAKSAGRVVNARLGWTLHEGGGP